MTLNFLLSCIKPFLLRDQVMSPFRLFSPFKTVFMSLLALSLLLNASFVIAKAELETVRVGQKADKTRVVFDISHNQSYKVSKLNNPSRVVVDFYKTKNRLNFKNKHFTDTRLYRLRVQDNKDNLRVILDLHKNFDYHSFMLAKNKTGAERLVIDLTQVINRTAPSPLAKRTPSLDTNVTQIKNVENVKNTDKTERVEKIKKAEQVKVTERVSTDLKPGVVGHLITTKSKPQNTVTKQNEVKEVRSNQKSQSLQSLLSRDSSVLVAQNNFVVAIDPGHGGKDPGAVSSNNIYEKDITLQVSRELKRLIDQQPGMKAVLTRDEDVFLPLHKRVAMAKKHQADIFISVHADGFHDQSVQGGSIYVLSNGGASSVMARVLAKSENASLQDIRLKEFDSDVAFALSDMSRGANVQASHQLANHVLKEMKRTVKMHKQTVQSANFAVLKSIDMPSLLVETAFISNPQEAKKLMDKGYQTKMASSIVRGLQRFVGHDQKQRWGETMYVQYRVQAGDTLSEIAQNYQVSTNALKKLNGIKNPHALYVGKKLRIPLADQRVAGLSF